MEPKRITQAMERITAAAERIAACAHTTGGAFHDGDLARRHTRLRDDASAALEELDQLLLALDR